MKSSVRTALLCAAICILILGAFVFFRNRSRLSRITAAACRNSVQAGFAERSLCRVALWSCGSGEVTVTADVPVHMRDSTILRADIYRPVGSGSFPVLLCRTPYNKREPAYVDLGYRLAQHGYLTVIQDVRGRFASDGEWYPFRHESADGYDSVEWAAALPGSDRQVGMYGGSYTGATQLLAAIARPPHLAAIAPQITPLDYHDEWVYRGGALQFGFDEFWTAVLLQNAEMRMLAPARFSLLPASGYLDGNVLQKGAPWFRDWLNHPANDDYWRQLSIAGRENTITVPAFHVGGWYDIFLPGTIHSFSAIRERAATPAARAGQRMLIGPWTHGSTGDQFNDVNFGPAASVDTDAVYLRWFDHVLRHAGNAVERERRVRFFLMGKNVWRDSDNWPPAGVHDLTLYLHSNGNANTAGGDGTLGPQSPDAEPPDRFVYDPAFPVPTRGGGLCCDQEVLPAGPFDQRPVEERRDVLVYSTPPLTEDTEVTGPVTVDLNYSSSAVDTDFTAKLVDVWPNGYARNLTDGIQRARYRGNSPADGLMKPGQRYKLTIGAGSTANVFLAGHRIRLEISSSNFPRFDRNLNNGMAQNEGGGPMKAGNSVYHDAAGPSALVLPVRR